MEKLSLENALQTVKNGSYIKIKFAKHCQTYKSAGPVDVIKETECVVRLGVSYSHINDEAIKDRIKLINEQGQPINTLPWGQWVSKYLIEHKGKFYLRCAVSRSPKHHPKTKWFKDGEIVTKEDVAELLTANEKGSNKELVFSLPIDNIISLGKEVK